MALFTHIQPDDLRRIAEAYDLGAPVRLVPIEAGTVNSNFFIDSAQGRHFLRVYEQQQAEGVRYEWRLLRHLRGKGLPVAAPLAGVEPGALRVEGKPVAVFDRLAGESLCQARVTRDHVERVGRTLARAHLACLDFDARHAGRFGLSDVRRLLRQAREAGRPELVPALARLEALAEELGSLDLGRLPQGVIHGDLFRDNVLWSEAHELSGLLDWESASDGAWLFDVAVTLLAWCCHDTLDWQLGAALVRGYQSHRPLEPGEWEALQDVLRLACLRFATTRITDVYLPGGKSERYKSYRRFFQRLDRVEALDAGELAKQLEGPVEPVSD